MTRLAPLAALGAVLTLQPAFGMDEAPRVFHKAELGIDWSRLDRKDLINWDGHAWIGGDRDKLWLRSEGEIHHGTVETAEFWGLYSRNVATFWDLQAGLRQDFEPRTTGYAVIGLSGLAPYFLETDAHLFVSHRGDVTARISVSYDLLITQRLIAEPHLEFNIAAQDVPELELGAGFNDVEAGLEIRYEIVRQFAPYLDINYERSLGETAAFARAAGEGTDAFTIRLGLRFWL